MSTDANGAVIPMQANPGPDLMGYPSVDALAQAKRASDAEAKRIVDQNRQLEQRLSALEAVNPRQEIPNRARSEERLSEWGLPVDALDEFVNTRLQKAFEPIANAYSGRTQLMSQYPDYNKFEAEVSSFLTQDPDLSQRYQRMFQADPAGAMEFAFLKFGESKRKTMGNGHENAQIQESQAHAALPNGRDGGTREPQAEGQDRVRAAWDHYQKTGRPEAYAMERLRQVTGKFL